ncbi:hypothetical protein NCCP602_15660 [Brevibacterium metallidurans]|uniref:Uncharacterized protein n=2 Tax=Brevibacterium TaxID=1696 RepID=A0ABP9U4H7_9MICO
MHESLLELDWLWLADFAPNTTRIATQPFHLQEQDGAHLRRHVLDIQLEHSNGSNTLVDANPATRLSDKRVQEQFSWSARLCGRKAGAT